MNNIFERFAPRWRRAVARYARAIWYGEDDQEADDRYADQAGYFSREYRYALENYYRKKDMKLYRGTLDGIVYEWLKKQEALKQTLKVIAQEKQNKLVEKEIERLKDTKDAQAMIDKLYGAKENETVYKVFSFKDNLEDLAKQKGDENAFELGSGINERIIQHFSDRYFWRDQKDRRVRNTHIQLSGKVFLFADPPTTIDRYGKKHTGNPGTDWGCVPSGTKIRLNSDVIRCFRRRFTGELTQIITESGIMLRATGNHPVLTQSGWKAANLVNVGDYVFKVTDKSIQTGETNIYDIGVPVEQIFDFFSLCGNTESVHGNTSDFHGDGIPEEKIDVVTVNWELTDKMNPETGEFIRKLIFTDSDMMTGDLFRSCNSEFNPLLFWLGLSSLSNISGSRDFLSLFGSGVLKSDDVGLTPVSCGYSSFGDKSFDKGSGSWLTEKLSSASDSTHAFGITFDDLIFEKVIAVDRVISDCHVYNLQTSTSWYIANGLLIHNCRCWAEIAPEKEKALRHYVVYEK